MTIHFQTRLGTLVGLFVFGSLAVVPSYGQSLADAARLQEERLKATGAQARTYTNTDVVSDADVLEQPSPLASASTEISEKSALEDFSPARYTSGALPPLPVLAVGGGQVFLELTVGVDGTVTNVTTLQTTPPFTDSLVNAVAKWSFLPAEMSIAPKPDEAVDQSSRRPVESKVLVAGQFRPPALYGGMT